MQSNHDSEMQAMSSGMRKAEKELNMKDEEVRHYKAMATQIAEQYEKTDKTITHLQNTVKEKDKDNDRLEGRIVEMEVRIGKLNTEKFELCQEFDKRENKEKELYGKIEDLNMVIQQLEREVEQKNSEILEREDAMKQMQDKLVKKGEQNKRLSETVNQFKNQLIEDQIFDEKYIVQQSGAIKTTDYTVS